MKKILLAALVAAFSCAAFGQTTVVGACFQTAQPCIVAVPLVSVNNTVDLGDVAYLSNAPAGQYRMTCTIIETTAATSSSTLPRCQMVATDPTDSVRRFLSIFGTNAGNTTATFGSSAVLADVKAGTNIDYNITGYVSSGATAMVYKAVVVLERVR